ncbi:MAG: FAD:protein FMN transferase [candidate division KSB1 bacterium]|nr:FAD:protein FMN transferase [candidate division KSB1 bacterium]
MIYTAKQTNLPDTWTFSHSAMNTRFDIWLCHTDVGYAEQAAFQAFEGLLELESQLSRFIPNSEISRINQSAGKEWIQVSPETLKRLKHRP